MSTNSSTSRRRVRRRVRRTLRSKARAHVAKPIWQQILDIVRRIPEIDLHKLPTDLSAHHDHYLSGQARS